MSEEKKNARGKCPRKKKMPEKIARGKKNAREKMPEEKMSEKMPEEHWSRTDFRKSPF